MFSSHFNFSQIKFFQEQLDLFQLDLRELRNVNSVLVSLSTSQQQQLHHLQMARQDVELDCGGLHTVSSFRRGSTFNSPSSTMNGVNFGDIDGVGSEVYISSHSSDVVGSDRVNGHRDRIQQPFEPFPQYVARTSSPWIPLSSSVDNSSYYGSHSSFNVNPSGSGSNLRSYYHSSNAGGDGVDDLDIRRVAPRSRAPPPPRKGANFQ